MSMEKKAYELFEKLQSAFGYTSAMKERDIKTIAEAFIDVSIEAIIADDRPVGPQDEKFIALADRGIEEGRRKVLVNKLKNLSAKPHSHRFWEISEIANDAISLLSFERKKDTDKINNNNLVKKARDFMFLFIVDGGDRGVSLDGIDPVDFLEKFTALETEIGINVK